MNISFLFKKLESLYLFDNNVNEKYIPIDKIENINKENKENNLNENIFYKINLITKLNILIWRCGYQFNSFLNSKVIDNCQFNILSLDLHILDARYQQKLRK